MASHSAVIDNTLLLHLQYTTTAQYEIVGEV